MLTGLPFRLLAALGLLLLSTPVSAGEVFSFVTEFEGDFGESSTRGRILVDGTRYRIEYEPEDDKRRSAIVSKDGGEHRFELNLDNRTYFAIETVPGPVVSHLFGLIPAWGDRSVKIVRLEVTEKPEPETINGSAVRRHEITLSYEITIKISAPPGRPPLRGPQEIVRGKVKLDAVYWMAEDKTPLPFEFLKPEIRTTFPEIDAKLAAAMATLRGLAVKQQVTVIAAGEPYVPPRASSITLTIEGPRPFKTPPSLFEVPSGYRMHKPEVIRPTLITDPSIPR